VKWYGKAEFWAAIGKVLLIIGPIIYTFITMLGGNPFHDRFGFRYWRDPGAFAGLYYNGNLGLFLGFLQHLTQVSFIISGPDSLSLFLFLKVDHLRSVKWVLTKPRYLWQPAKLRTLV
jgi:amino acid transporter